MSYTPRIPAIEVTGAYGSIMKVAARKMLGKMPDSAGVMWHYPAILKDLMGFNRKAEKWNVLDENLSILGRMAAAAAVGCSACLDINYFMAHRQGLDEAKVREVPRWRESSIFTPLERRVMEYASAMCETPVAVTDELSAELLEDIGPAALLELSARVGLMNASARINIALGIRSEEFADTCGLTPLAPNAVAVGSTA